MAKSASRSATPSDKPEVRPPDKPERPPSASSIDGLQKLNGHQPITTEGVDAFAELIAEHPELGSPDDIAVMRTVLSMQERIDKVASGYFDVVPEFINFTGGPQTIAIVAKWDGSEVTAETFAAPATLFPNLVVHSGRLDADGMFRWTVTLRQVIPVSEHSSTEAEDDPQ